MILPKLLIPLANLQDEDGGVKPYTDVVAEAARRMIDAANLFITVAVDVDDEIDCRCKERLFFAVGFCRFPCIK